MQPIPVRAQAPRATRPTTAKDRITNPLLHVVGALTVLCSLAVIATGYQRFPAPYDPSLCPVWLRERSLTTSNWQRKALLRGDRAEIVLPQSTMYDQD